MKHHIAYSILMTAVLLTSGCAQDEAPDIPLQTHQLTFIITDSGYAANLPKSPASRTSENGYTTEFTPGDACGLYIVRSGSIVCDNAKLTATDTDGTLTWQADNGTSLTGGLPGESYFLYYPYTQDMSGKTSPEATTAEAFFANLTAGWQVTQDQSTAANYTASDLMTADGTATKEDGKLRLSFSMTHRMALAVVEMPASVTVLVHSDTGNHVSELIVDSKPVEFTSDEKALSMNDKTTCRYIMKPSDTVPLSGSYADGRRKFSLTLSGIAAGTAQTYRLDDAR